MKAACLLQQITWRCKLEHYQMRWREAVSSYSHAPYTDVLVNEGLHIRRCSHKIKIL